MTWYGVSLLFVTKTIEDGQTIFPVSEEVYLINASNDEEAWREAEKIGQYDAAINGVTDFNGISANREFLGIRKLRSIYNPVSAKDIDKTHPVHGSEITRSDFEIVGESSLEDLKNGRPVSVLYVDGAI